jgi:hypothetical protein
MIVNICFLELLLTSLKSGCDDKNDPYDRIASRIVCINSSVLLLSSMGRVVIPSFFNFFVIIQRRSQLLRSRPEALNNAQES